MNSWLNFLFIFHSVCSLWMKEEELVEKRKREREKGERRANFHPSVFVSHWKYICYNFCDMNFFPSSLSSILSFYRSFSLSLSLSPREGENKCQWWEKEGGVVILTVAREIDWLLLQTIFSLSSSHSRGKKGSNHLVSNKHCDSLTALNSFLLLQEKEMEGERERKKKLIEWSSKCLL